MNRATPKPRAAFRHFAELATRWADNDAYGHINNVAYYGFFDTVVNGWLIANGLLDVAESPCIGLVVETGCHYFSPLAYPQAVDVGLAVAHIGNSSVKYELGVFAKGAGHAAAQGHFVHVYVDRASRKATSVPEGVRRRLELLRGEI
jgi:acyl-CoA thioester hydrolase